jgi:hypothetical protein
LDQTTHSDVAISTAALVFHGACRFATRGNAKQAIAGHIEIYDSRIRKPARLGYLAPAVLMQKDHEKRVAA